MADGPEAVMAAMTGWAGQKSGWNSSLAWSLVDMGPASEVPPPDLDESEHEELEERVREVLVVGCASRAELAELAEEYLVTEDRRPVSREQAAVLADQMWLERVAEQTEWQDEPAPERLTRAFTALQGPASRPAKSSPAAAAAASPRSVAKAAPTPVASSTSTRNARTPLRPATD